MVLDLKKYLIRHFGDCRVPQYCSPDLADLLFKANKIMDNIQLSNAIILSKESSESEIKAYFNAVLKLQQSSDEFPVNLDSVWSLVYGRKEEAVRALTSDPQFIESVDFQSLRRNAEQKNGRGGQNRVDYHLSISCMEFFIARKVRSVFEVYRQVFHAVAKQEFQIPQTYSEALLLAANQAKDIENLQHENKQLTSENTRNQPKVEFANCIMQSDDCISIGEMANILKQNGLFRKGQNIFFEWLRYNGYLICRGVRYNLPTQKSMNNDVMRIVERPSMTKGMVTINRSAVITPYGQQYFIKLFQEKKHKGGAITTLFGY